MANKNPPNPNSQNQTPIPPIVQLSPELTAQLLNPSVSPQHIVTLVPVKLSTTNYILWRFLITPVLQQYNFYSLVDGTDTTPAILLPDSTQINPAYTEWAKRDRTCRIWLTATLSDSVLPFQIGCISARSIWVTLERRLANITWSHVLQLKRRLQTLQKGTQSMTNYLQQIKDIADSLAHAGEPLDNADVVAHTLQGLPQDYDAFATSIRVHAEPIQAEELHGFLLSEEIEVQRRGETLIPNLNPNSTIQAYAVFNPLSNITGPNYHFQGTRGSSAAPNRNRNFQPRPPTNNSSRSFFRPPPPPPRQTNHGGALRIRCQICGRNNHSAVNCFNRMNYAYQGRTPPPRFQAMMATPLPLTPSAPPSLWYVDSGATHHITNDLSNLSIAIEYHGNDHVSTANGDSMPISLIGSSTAVCASPTLGSSATSGSSLKLNSIFMCLLLLITCFPLTNFSLIINVI
ncbi:hypothetical protein M0R45_036882 [Rubus argutus]|uniref:Uncharacterized protein n=1 Tax=Rubus argutus TaxID=59490 RepID=A0AAW1W195_RUBAR